MFFWLFIIVQLLILTDLRVRVTSEQYYSMGGKEGLKVIRSQSELQQAVLLPRGSSNIIHFPPSPADWEIGCSQRGTYFSACVSQWALLIFYQTSHEMVMQCVSRVISHPLHGECGLPSSSRLSASMINLVV